MEQAAGIYARRDELVEAASIYTQLVELEPNEGVHRENLRQVRERLGNTGEEIKLPRLVPDMSAIAEKFLSEPTLKTVAATTARDQAAGREPDDHDTIDGYIVEGDLFAGYGLYQKAIEQYLRVIDVIPNHIEVREKIRDMYAKSGDLAKAAQECLILVNIYTARNDSENANRNFTLAYQYDPNLHQEPIYPQPGVEGVSRAHPAPEPPKPKSSSKAQSAGPSPKRLEEILQEIDFYLDLNFLSEAKASIDQYLQFGSSTDSEFEKRMERYQGMVHSQGGGGHCRRT
jgi:tetratricopeptide (TPR) repeat protein